jgi:uncharacterized membrane protein
MKEHHYRSVIKGATWRVWATMDTILLAWLFTGQIESALKIGAVEVFTKIFVYYVHERLWMKFDWWRIRTVQPDGSTVVTDQHHRSLIKGASYRFFGTLDTIIIAFFVTGNYTKAFSIGVTEVFTKIGFYYLHERLWMKISWGLYKDTPAVASPALESAPVALSPVLSGVPAAGATSTPAHPLTVKEERVYAVPPDTNMPL